jgi:hypothetical protein
MGKKRELLVELFEHCKRVGNMEFDNSLVKQLAEKHACGCKTIRQITNLSYPFIVEIPEPISRMNV